MNVNAEEVSQETVVDVEKEDYINKEVIVNKTSILSTIVKRIVDICAGIIGVVLLIPLTFILFLANMISKDTGPVFFIQKRIGKNGKIFKMYKYRSMVVGAEEKLEKYLDENEDAKIEYKKYKKLKDDPRVTKVGSFIRRYSIDEMPQLLNLLIRKYVFSWTKALFTK